MLSTIQPKLNAKLVNEELMQWIKFFVHYFIIIRHQFAIDQSPFTHNEMIA